MNPQSTKLIHLIIHPISAFYEIAATFSPTFLSPFLFATFKQIIRSVFIDLKGYERAEKGEKKKFPSVTEMADSKDKRFESKHYLS